MVNLVPARARQLRSVKAPKLLGFHELVTYSLRPRSSSSPLPLTPLGTIRNRRLSAFGVCGWGRDRQPYKYDIEKE